MSNFGVTYLLKKQKGSNRLSIEDNIGEELHIHFGNIRVMMKNEEYRQFASHALEYISDITEISVDDLSKLEPIFLFDLCRRGELSSLALYNEEYVSVGSLLCPVYNKFGVCKYKSINKSHFLKVINNTTKTTPFDLDQVNYIGKDNITRCFEVLEECRQDKCICDKYPLFVTSENIIRDGQHRAAALYYLYGPNYKVKVQRMETNKSFLQSSKQSLFKTMKYYSGRIIRITFGLFSKPLMYWDLSKKKSELKKYNDSIEKTLNVSCFENLKKDIELKKNVFFVDSDYSLSGFPVIIRRFNSDFSVIKALLSQRGLLIKKGHCMEGKTFIYGLKEDYLIVDSNGNPVAYLQNKLSSYAMSVNSFMPYAPSVQKYLNTFEDVPETILYTLRLLKCMFDKKRNGFFESDIEYFESHKQLLDDGFFSKDGLIKEVLFGYTDRMLQLLHAGKYDDIIDDYRRFEY